HAGDEERRHAEAEEEQQHHATASPQIAEPSRGQRAEAEQQERARAVRHEVLPAGEPEVDGDGGHGRREDQQEEMIERVRDVEQDRGGARCRHAVNASATFAAIIAATRAFDSRVTPAMCGVSSKFGHPASGEPAARGSVAKTSRAAPPRRPARSAAATAASSTTPPRAVLMSTASRFIVAMRSASTRLRVAGVRGTCSETTSASAMTSAKVRGVTA